ncbi:hypothetical protein [Streptomyces sp. NPDC088707]|uniref:hypothetical protein n=1 Tax=Streptomyces sp. NPDC088707 TaxID=3365871 RepID=UPI0037F105DB
MPIHSAPLNILLLPRRWEPRAGTSTLTLAVLVIPKGDPRAPFLGTPTAFADADLSFDAVLVPSPDALPAPDAPANVRLPLATVRPARKRALFDALAGAFTIRPASTPDDPGQPQGVKKFLPPSYRQATHYTGSDSPFFVTDRSYDCALKATAPSPAPGEPGIGLDWEEILALVLRQPLLATELGLIHETRLDFPAGAPSTDNPFARGGYLYADLATDGDYGTETGSTPGLLARFAARIPPLDAAHRRPVFAAVLFPVDGTGGDTFDEVFVEADAYDGGFARAVHGSQARTSAQVEVEAEPPADALPPVKDTGIRLGWDDEQVTIWVNRQFDVNASGPGASPDAPLGVAGYRVDVREEPPPGTPAGSSWHSLVAVRADALDLAGVPLGAYDGELSVETVPVNHTFDPTGPFWLPSYFTAWTGGSVVLTDPEAFRITGDPDLGARAVYRAVTAGTPALRYGRTYRFRVRLMDLAGGGPTVSDAEDPTAGAAPTATVPFRRFVPPGAVRVAPDGGLLADGRTAIHRIHRPLLGHPDIVHTGFPNAMDLLLADAVTARAEQREAALPDPDATHVRIDVLVRTPAGDPAAGRAGRAGTSAAADPATATDAHGSDSGSGPDSNSNSGSDTSLPYVPLYSVVREFPPGVDQPLVLRSVFKDEHRADALKDVDLGPLDPLWLPTARDVRLVLTAVGTADPALAYWGSQQARTGSASVALSLRVPSADERELLRVPADGRDIQAVFLQPDPPSSPALAAQLAVAGRRRHDAPSDLVDRLADRLGLVRSGLTLSAPAGTRLVMGVSNGLRHTLNPDRSSVTFASKDDLALRWLVCVRLTVARDWTWDALEPVAFTVRRDGETVGELVLPARVNETAARHTEPGDGSGTGAPGTGSGPGGGASGADGARNRDRTELLFVDAYDPTRVAGAPREARLDYTLTPSFRGDEQSALQDPDPAWELRLPVTTPPTQVPRLLSAGFAASGAVRDPDRYTFTGERRRMLSVELDRSPDDPDDRYFARVLAYGPDPMLLDDVVVLPEPAEPPLDVDEPVRVVTPSSSRDCAGITAMQQLIPAEPPPDGLPGAGHHYLLPLPEGLHPDAPELLGFFVYELRVGHDCTRWSTARGRFGLPLRVAGVQHPPPPLRCAVTRTEHAVTVTAPHAAPVHEGADIRPFPPRTTISALLYAQVRQADGADWRNVLLRTHSAPEPDDQVYDPADRPYFQSVITFPYADIRGTLDALGLPADASLSVLAVELLPTASPERDPLTAGLGSTGILRTSPLTAVPAVCLPQRLV